MKLFVENVRIRKIESKIIMQLNIFGELFSTWVLYLARIINAEIHSLNEINIIDIRSIEKFIIKGKEKEFTGSKKRETKVKINISIHIWWKNNLEIDGRRSILINGIIIFSIY